MGMTNPDHRLLVGSWVTPSPHQQRGVHMGVGGWRFLMKVEDCCIATSKLDKSFKKDSKHYGIKC
jgi:hypothetical protein